MFQKTITYFSIIVIVIGAIFLANGLILAWTSPTASPPGSNVPAPLNTGSTGQSKSGGLILNTGGAATGLIVSQGNVGIGTIEAAGHQLDVASYQGTVDNSAIRALYPSGGGLANTEFAALANRDACWTALYAKQGAASSAAYFDGNVGIRTTSPRTELDINGELSLVNSTYGIRFYNGVANNWAYIKSGSPTTGGALTLGDDQGDLITLTSGQVGIGTESPDDKLHIVGNAFLEDSSPEITFETGAAHYNWQIAAQENKDTGFEISVGSQDADASDDSFSPKMVVLQSGNVGIGTAGPGAKLDIVADSQTWGGWYEAIRFSQGPHSAITLPSGGLLFGLHSNRNFYWADTTNSWYAMYLNANGNLWIRGFYSSPYCDIAEIFEPSQENNKLESGDIVVLDEKQEKKIKKSSQPYSALVVGIVSTNPNMTMGLLEDGSNEDHPPVALLGRVPTKVTTENGPIKIGDLITTSSKPGYGMRCDDYDKCQGAIIGKALQNLEEEEGMIEVLIKGGF
jgi:hypothetical protein